MQLKQKRYEERKARVKARIIGDRPRLSISKSNKYIYAQVIDDEKGVTLVSLSGAKTKSGEIGENLAKKAIAKKIKKVVFDRGGYKFHGVVAKFAEGARKGGLVF